MLSKEKIIVFLNKLIALLKPPIVRFFKTFFKMMQQSKWLGSFLMTIIVCLICIKYVDQPLAVYFKNHLEPYTEGFYKTITDLGLSGWWFGLSGLLWLFFIAQAGISMSTDAFEQNIHKAKAFLFMISALTASSLIGTFLKVIFGRYRPRYLFDEGLYGFSPFNFDFAVNSFPSGHALSIWTAMMALKFILPRYDLAYLAVAVLVALSRFFTTVHYLSDVLMGAYLGIAITCCVKAIFEEDGFKVVIKCRRDQKLL